MVKPSQPLFRFDAGWLFVAAGLVLILAAAVVPSERQLHSLRSQLDELRHAQRSNDAIISAYARFVSDLDGRDPSLVRRLAASQLNVIPRGETPLLMASSVNASTSEWIEATADLEPFRAPPPPDTLLARWTSGRGRLWAIGAGGFLVFAGLMIGATPAAARRGGSTGESEGAEAAEATEAADDVDETASMSTS